jgi:CO/xanthine dehydrogenase Mo-binding subunit
METVGSSHVRADAWAKVTGAERFVDDIVVPGAWVGGTVRSPVARGRIRSVRFDPGFDWSRVRVVTAADLPGPNVVSMIRDDHPILAAKEVRFVSEAIALVAARDVETLAGALAAVEVDVDELPPVLGIEEALSGERIIWGKDNLLAEYRIERGDPETAFAGADRIIEGTYRTGHQEHLYLEPNGIVALPRAGGGIEIFGSLQCPFYIHRAIANGLGLSPDYVVVRQVATGGAFGGKEDFPSVLALHAAVLARASSAPVRMIYSRTEDIRATTKRHPSRVRWRSGVMNDGTIMASEIDLVLDGGAYTTLSPVVLSRSVLHAGGAYRIPNIRIHGRAVATNTPPNGAFRGFGAPQSLFAAERQIDRIARELGLDPVKVRRRNLLRDGDRMPFGQLLDGGTAAELVLDSVIERSGYARKRAEYGRAQGEGAPAGRIRRGIGLSLYVHGGGFTGAGEEKIAGRAKLAYTPERGVEILISNVEMGQGASTVLCQIVAEALGAPVERVSHPFPDTGRVPDTGPTVASRTTMIVGRILIDAANDMRAKLGPGTFVEAAERYVREVGPLTVEAAYVPVEGQSWDEEAYRGDAYKAYSWGADVVEVEVDTETMEVRPLRATVVVEIGRAIHPILVAGQVEGGTLQAIGYGSVEEVKLDKGRYLNDRMATYIIPTSLDAPEFEVGIEEVPYARGPFGAKGLGELPADGGAPALAAAIDQAVGIFVDEIPATPERLLEADGAR